ncbi:MAG: MMPL family transporter [Luteibacter sp.]|uniref:MMPL family transporter n=1 Tax=Luteibacter sp. TaxID=1886636 RepID=UPI00280841FC|nr:MMPL family transporter [Luteibacter sp.]MDQ7996025.1 MMPL family transporter [Luteibacter sp.]MDQ8048790.1 MMPL family transporter [Luteibacter sp.]
MRPSPTTLQAGLFTLVALGICLFCAWLLFGRGTSPLQTDIMTILPATERHPLAEDAVERLARASGDRMILLVSNDDDDAAKTAARELGEALGKDPVFASVIAELPPFDLDQLVTPFLPFRFHLLTPEDRAALTSPGFDAVAALRRRLNEPFGANVGAKLTDDPFGWMQHWLDRQPWNRSTLVPEDDMLTAHQGDTTYVLVIATLKGSSYDDVVQRKALATLATAESAMLAKHPGTTLQRTGAIFYAAAARAGAERDTHVVGIASSVGIAVLLLLVFRSLRPLLIAFLSTALGVVGAIVATVLVFGQLHLLTLVFGAALLGEAVDYSIQYLCARANTGAAWNAERGVRQVRPALLLALATSLLGYALLGIVPFPALQQMAVFAMAGMAVACASVFWLLPALAQKPARAPLSPALVRLALGWQRAASGRRALVVLAVLAVAAIPGWLRLGHDDDIHLLISPPKTLEAQTASIRDVAGFGGGTQFWLVEGASAEEVLQREEALTDRLRTWIADGKLTGFTGITAMLPSAKRQAENIAAVAPLFTPADRMNAWLAAAGFRPEGMASFVTAYPGRAFTLDDWLAMPAYTPFHYLWLSGSHGTGSIVVPQGQDDVALLRQASEGLPGVSLVDKPASISALFGRYRGYADVWLGGALALVGLAFLWRYGPRAVGRVLLPPLAGIVFSVAALGYLGQPLTLFHIMALMLVLGVGANYAVFLREGEPHAAHIPGAAYAGVLLSAVTALLSFGLLALSTMPALQHFGLTLLLGIGFTALIAPVSVPAPKKSSA